uniref:UDP-N-acetylglucosamine transferase subunit ALG14 n=1 Tax=Meloidogyne enterolobii TaxID=390850 RepID=A0A6V7VD07_MELEN|nr:unnamed protein product [Meloidogyne enterolobii]
MFEAFSFLQLISLFITSLLILNIFLFILNVSLRLLKEKENNKVDENGNLKLMAIIGSGGHTTEMLKLLISTIDSNLFSDRIYVIADSDKLSNTKVSDFERQIGKNNFLTYKIPRARNVGQSYCSSILTTLIASWHSAKLLRITRPDLILCNGPAICLPICLFARLFNFLRIKRIKIIFVESICRVQTLSLTGRILYHLNIPDAFLVQWPSLKEKYIRTQFIGRLV